jgi:sugar lactone lactonase YvrE
LKSLEAELLLDARADLGEGPIWHPDRKLVSWVELYEGRVNWLSLDGTAREPDEIGRRVGVAVPAAGGAVALATDEGFSVLDGDGSPRLVAPVENDGRDSFLNDGKCDAAGRFWAGTVGVNPETGLAVENAGSLYVLEPDGGVRVALSGLTLSNGLDWSPDGETLYFIDSFTWGIDAYPFDVDAGELGEPRRVLEIPREEGFADGMCVDADGCLWVAVWGPGEVRRYTPSGELDAVVRLPVSEATSCAFAGDELDVLVITSASRLLDDEQRAQEPHAGSVFACRPGARGQQTNPWGGR